MFSVIALQLFHVILSKDTILYQIGVKEGIGRMTSGLHLVLGGRLGSLLIISIRVVPKVSTSPSVIVWTVESRVIVKVWIIVKILTRRGVSSTITIVTVAASIPVGLSQGHAILRIMRVILPMHFAVISGLRFIRRGSLAIIVARALIFGLRS